ncbi:MAG TPA: AI-2E family transporter YdiK [Casimicrobiaceae bacterium]|nr:AI-2E family transporter YdiK [Casimicrobiaceae bacterium]
MNEQRPNPLARGDLTRTVLAVLLIATLIATSLWVLRPFLLALVWATMIVVATWPLMLKVQTALRRRWLAVTVMTGAMLIVFVVPLVLAIQSVVENADTITRTVRSVAASEIPPPPEWVAKIPMVGAQISSYWHGVAEGGKAGLVARLAPYAGDAAKWLAGQFGDVGLLVLHFLLTVTIAAILYANGETASAGVIRFGRRLAGDRGESVVRLAGQAIRGVALGVVGTALIQTALAGLGLAVAGIPYAALLTAVVLFLCIAQVGPLIVLAPAVIWLFWIDATGRGTMLLVWSIVVGLLDNVLRPILIRRGADLPMLLIFAGVLGGLFAFGIVGLFVGPVMLAVTYTLLLEWVTEQGDDLNAKGPPPSRDDALS